MQSYMPRLVARQQLNTLDSSTARQQLNTLDSSTARQLSRQLDSFSTARQAGAWSQPRLASTELDRLDRQGLDNGLDSASTEPRQLDSSTARAQYPKRPGDVAPHTPSPLAGLLMAPLSVSSRGGSRPLGSVATLTPPPPSPF